MSHTLKKNKEIQGKQELLLVSLNKFYQETNNKEYITELLNGEGKISLRIIDWFVTNYAKKKNIEYLIKTKNNPSKKTFTLKKNGGQQKLSKKDLSKYNSAHRQINIFLSYKSQLRAYSKKQFDPFCRRNRIDFYFNETEYITTTVGQLNFFRWALQNNVIDYILNHYEEIENDMNENTKKQRIQTKLQKKKKGDINTIVKEELNTQKQINYLSDLSNSTDILNLNPEIETSIGTDNSNNNNDNNSDSSSHSSDDNLDTNSESMKKKKDRKKRQPLSVAATNNMNKNNVPVLLSFD